jgi:hypothetical protein
MQIDNPGHIKSWLQTLTPSDFEVLVGEVWEELGYTTFVTPKSNDKGIDVVASKEDPFRRRQLIQVKRFTQGNKIGSKTIREYRTLYDQEPDVDSVIIITSNDFTPQAKELADDLDVKTLDGFELGVLIQQEAQNILDNRIEENNTVSESESQKSPISDSSADSGPKYGHLINRSDSSADRDEKETSGKPSSQSSDSAPPSTLEDEAEKGTKDKKEYNVYEEEIRDFYSGLDNGHR